MREYIVPLKALANEKFEDLTEIANVLGFLLAWLLRDRGESSGVENSDILFAQVRNLILF